MANETIKALLMIAAFGALEASLYLPQIFNRPRWKRVREAMVLHWPHGSVHEPISYALVPVGVRRHPRRH